MEPLRLVKTYTTKLLLPMVVNDDITYDLIFSNNFIDSYIIDIGHEDFCFMDENLIITRADYVDEHYNERIYTSSCIDTYRSEDDDRDVIFFYVHKIIEKWVADYYNIITGDYKNISKEYIDHLLRFWKLDKASFLYYILTIDKDNIKKYIEEHERNSKSPWSSFVKKLDTYEGIPFNFDRESYGIIKPKGVESVDFTYL